MEAQRLRRLLQLLAVLPRVPQCNRGALAHDFAVDERTIRRDFAVLADSGLATLTDGQLWLDTPQAEAVDRMVMASAPGSSLARSAWPERAAVLA